MLLRYERDDETLRCGDANCDEPLVYLEELTPYESYMYLDSEELMRIVERHAESHR